MNSEPGSTTEHLLAAAFRYIETGNAEALRDLLSIDAAVARARDPIDHQGAIHAAAAVGSVEMLSALIDAGADPSMRQGERIVEDGCPVYLPGMTPLHYAARSDHLAVVDFLLKYVADASAEDQWGGTPLHETRSVPVARLLLRAGADPNAHCSLRHFDETFGWAFVATPLHIAARWGIAPMIQLLVEHGASVDHPETITGRTPLHCAAMCGRQAATDLLLTLGANPNAMCEVPAYAVTSRMTPLHYAARYGHLGVVKSLVKAGADLRTPGGEEGMTAAELASEREHYLVAELLESAGDPRTTAAVLAQDMGTPVTLDGACRCVSDDPAVAAEALGAVKATDALVDESHFAASICRCGACGRSFLFVFCEEIDWDDGDDRQSWVYVPITADEASELRELGSPAEEGGILRIVRNPRRFLIRSFGAGPGRASFWANGSPYFPMHD